MGSLALLALKMAEAYQMKEQVADKNFDPSPHPTTKADNDHASYADLRECSMLFPPDKLGGSDIFYEFTTASTSPVSAVSGLWSQLSASP